MRRPWNVLPAHAHFDLEKVLEKCVGVVHETGVRGGGQESKHRSQAEIKRDIPASLPEIQSDQSDSAVAV
jgi:hypothetical protein